MSFQGYLATIAAKTGRDAQGLSDWAEARGLSEHGALKPGIKAGMVVTLAKEEFGLGHGHATAVYALLSGKKHEGDQ